MPASIFVLILSKFVKSQNMTCGCSIWLLHVFHIADEKQEVLCPSVMHAAGSSKNSNRWSDLPSSHAEKRCGHFSNINKVMQQSEFLSCHTTDCHWARQRKQGLLLFLQNPLEFGHLWAPGHRECLLSSHAALWKNAHCKKNITMHHKELQV